jgi:hypothetical protein
MLGERRYYKDQASSIMNVFDCGAQRNSSHFTSLRLIRALLQRRGESTREGQGYVEIAQILGTSEDVFDNSEDVLRTLNRLIERQLIEANTRSIESICGASHVRVTSAGWYYSRFLMNSFSYLDLVLQDTPLNDGAVEERLREFVHQVDNLGDREDERLARMGVRFERVRVFLEYLEQEEEREAQEFDLARSGGIWAEPFVPAIRETIEGQIEWIERRLRENRERIVDDIHFSASEEPTELAVFGEPEDEHTTDPTESITGRSFLFGEGPTT